MKSALFATCLGLVLALVMSSSSSCAIDHRSGEFECSDQPCPSGRICVSGLCVDPIDAGVVVPIDAPGSGSDHLDAGSGSGSGCPAACTSCTEGTKACTIDCGLTSCSGAVTCPTGWTCDVKCNQPAACGEVDCSGATACTVECSGTDSCEQVECGADRCDIECTGTDSCEQVDCNDSCGCDVTCSQQSSCDQVTCTNTVCDTQSGGCSSQRAVCHTCPAATP